MCHFPEFVQDGEIGRGQPPRNPLTPPQSVTYSQIDIILDKMLQEVEEQEQKLFSLDLDVVEPHCVNTLELLPTTDALIEVPIKKSIKVPKRKVYETSQCIQVTENPYELVNFGGNGNVVMSVPVEGDEACNLLEYCGDSFGDKPFTSHYTLEFSKPSCASAESLNDSVASSPTYLKGECIDPEEHDYEPIDTQSVNNFDYQLHDGEDVWWEGTYRNLSVVPEEDEETAPSDLLEPLVSEDSSSSDSPDEGSYDLAENLVKAEVKLMVKTVDKGRENIEIRSVRDFIQPKEGKKSKLGSKLHKLGSKVSNFLHKEEPSFTLPRLFVKTPEGEGSKELVATSNNKMPLELDYGDLYANPPFYPAYPSSPTLIRPTTAYCDWLPLKEDCLTNQGKAGNGAGHYSKRQYLTGVTQQCCQTSKIISRRECQRQFVAMLPN